ncbi:MAG: phosphoribosylformylglycinamidine synthase subunit PurS [Alphaproteobacteria bacterium]
MKARVLIMPREGVLDPQGKAIAHALNGLGFAGVDGARQGKLIELELAGSDIDAARQEVVEMCEKLLANQVIETFRIHIEA